MCWRPARAVAHRAWRESNALGRAGTRCLLDAALDAALDACNRRTLRHNRPPRPAARPRHPHPAMPGLTPPETPLAEIARPRARNFLRHAVQVALANVVVALVIAGLRGGRLPQALTYAEAIGLSTWAIIDFGRFLIPHDPHSGWPGGWRGLALIAGGTLAGWLIGSTIGNAVWGYSTFAEMQVSPRGVLGDLTITLVIGTIISGYFYIRGTRAHHAARVAASERDATRARLSMLQSQLEPHMLFNTLANLRALIAADPARAQAMLDRLIDFLRATLAASRAPSQPLADEFARVADYLALMQVRMGERLVVALELPAALAAQPVPPLLLQPLVENAIKHGLEPRRGAGRLRVAASSDGDALVLTVVDDGLGRDAARAAAAGPGAAPSTGFGLAQVRERLQTLHGDAAQLTLADAPGGGTRAEIRLPMSAAAAAGAPA